ncbi:hypothetical protein GCM10010411_47770 [Actinomadura fulvescens]|uniref:Uncharacterized protein n=1 Tax=Actinomadura fulvescens TaxID=46160 RepID=A0ABP6CBT0_9ACTN
MTIFGAGLMLGGWITASALWLLSGIGTVIPSPAVVGATGVAGVLATLRDAKVLSCPLPEARRLVPERVLRKGPLVGPFQFGWEMGTGVRTYLSSTLPYLVALALVLTQPSYVMAMIGGLAFGLGRAAMLVSRLVSHDGEEWDTRLAASLGWLSPFCTAAGAAAGFWIAISSQ